MDKSQVSLTIMCEQIKLETESGKLCFHRHSLRGTVQDFIITFNEDVGDVETAVSRALELFIQLMDHFKDHTIRARLIAQIQFFNLNSDMEVVGSADYHFASYRAEIVIDPNEFFERHMCKIASRLDEFNEQGSRLLIDHIQHLHISIIDMSTRVIRDCESHEDRTKTTDSQPHIADSSPTHLAGITS